MTKVWDAIVIGGGIAGSSVAIKLAQIHKKVLLIEKEKNAHHKVCGEFISIEAQHYIGKLGINLDVLGAKKIDHVSFLNAKKHIKVSLPFHAKSLSRKVLDESLLKKATESGVDVQMGIAVTSMTKTFNVWEVTLSNNKIVHATVVYLASGKHDVRGFARTGQTHSNLIGFKMYFEPEAKLQTMLENCVELIFFEHGYAGIELVENNIVNLSLVVDKKYYSSIGKSWQKLLEMLAQESLTLKQCLKSSKPMWDKPLAVFGIPYGFIYRNENKMANLYHLGDQMAVISSFSGDGMSIALHTAFLAAHHSLHGDSTSFHQAALKHLKCQIQQATFFSSIVKSSFGRKLVMWVATYMPFIIKMAIKHTRVNQIYID